jgi:hypothetical protein
MAKLYLKLQEVWLQSRPKGKVEESLNELLARTKQGVVDWRQVKTGELRQLYVKLRGEFPDLKVPSHLSLWLKKHNPFLPVSSRAYVTAAWRRWYLHVWNPLKWVEVWLFEGVNGLLFFKHLITQGR